MKSDKKNKEQAFRKLFIDLIYDNMAMEDEIVFSKRELSQRCKLQIDNLIKENIHSKIIIPKKYYV